MSSVLELSCTLVPNYLRKGQYFVEQTEQNSDAIVCVHSDYMPPPNIKSHLELIRVLRALIFWMVEDTPAFVFDYVRLNTTEVQLGDIQTSVVDIEKTTMLADFHFIVTGQVKHDTSLVSIKCFEYMYHAIKISLRNDWMVRTCKRFIKNNHIECVRCAFRFSRLLMEPKHNRNMCTLAATYGSIECLQFLCELGLQVNHDTCTAAAHNDHVNCLEYAHKRGFIWKPDIAENTALRGHIDCLQYLHENNMIDRSIEYITNHDTCIQYLHEHGYLIYDTN